LDGHKAACHVEFGDISNPFKKGTTAVYAAKVEIE